MHVFKTISSLRQFIKKQKQQKKTIGFVPTMGALHAGHASLLRYARRENDFVILSIFVNPTQFGPNEDFKKYPRPFKKDLALAETEGTDIIFYPSAKIIYPREYLTYIEVNGNNNQLCGRSRPGHFKGVTTVVGKLLNIVTPDVMYLGQKDAQQAIILKKMVEDLNFDVQIKVCPIIRETDGLAMSSRNQYLSKQERQEAPILFQALNAAKQRILAGERNSKKIIQTITSLIKSHSTSVIEYIECVEANSLTPLKILKGNILIALAVKFGNTRLIDNIVVRA